jgi:hypothetical protein
MRLKLQCCFVMSASNIPIARYSPSVHHQLNLHPPTVCLRFWDIFLSNMYFWYTTCRFNEQSTIELVYFMSCILMSQCPKRTSRLLHQTYHCKNEGLFLYADIFEDDTMKICLSLLIKRHICQISRWDDTIEPEIERSWRRTGVGKMKLNQVANSLNNFMPYIKSTQGLTEQGRIWHNWGWCKGYSPQGVSLS